METSVTEIAPDIFRFSTFIPDAGLAFNQFLVNDEEPLLFHTGMKALFPARPWRAGASHRRESPALDYVRSL